MVECRLCGQHFYDDDDDLDERKKRHEDHHNPTKPHGSFNQTWNNSGENIWQ